MMILFRPFVVLGNVVVVLTIHPLRHPHTPPYVHDNHTTRQLHHVLTVAFIRTMLLLIEVIDSALASSVASTFSSIILALNHSYDILGARMLWKPKEARILKNLKKNYRSTSVIW
jgi:hypothetical protein